MKALTIAQRVKLLQQGLNDRSESVKEVVQKQLLQAWLRLADGNVLELLHRLDVESCPDIASPALNAIFSLSPLNDLIKHFSDLNDRKVIPVEKLTAENALFWRALSEYLKSKEEAFLEYILPEPAIYADYLLSYLQNMPVLNGEEREDMTCIERLMTKEFIGQQLLIIIGCMDTTEEGGRKRLLTVLQEILMIPTTSASLIPPLMENLLYILKDDDRRIQTVAQIISEVREAVITLDKPPDATEIRKQQLKMAEIKVKLIEAKDALEKCVALQDFNHASYLKERIIELENIRSGLLKETEEPLTKEICIEKNDPDTLLKCLLMCSELLKQLSISKGLGPTMDGIIESLIIPGITNIHPAVRNMAVLCLGRCGLQKKDFASQHLPLLLQVLQIDEMKIKISSLKALFDQVMLFGIEPFKVKKGRDPQSENEDSDKEVTKDNEEEIVTTHNLLQLLSSFLDSEVSELRTESAEGLAKLIFSGRLISAKLLSRLLLLWYNPVTEEDTRLRHCLGVFFPLFAYSNRANQECFEEAFIPTLQILFNAPASSPLSEVDVTNVTELLVDLTRPSGLNQCIKNSQNYEGLTIHDNLALKICNEILMDPNVPDVRVYAKALSSLELSKNFTTDLLILFDEIIEKVKDKTCLKIVEKMKTSFSGGNPISGDNYQVTKEIVTQNATDPDVLHDSNRRCKPTDQKEEAKATEKRKKQRPKPRQNTPSPARSASTAASMPQEHLEDDQIPSRQPSTLSPTSARSSTWEEDSHDLSTVVEVPLSPSNIQDLTSDLPIRMPLDTQAHRPPLLALMPRTDAAPTSTIVQEPPRTKAQAKRVRLPADARRSQTPERNDRPLEREDHPRHSCCSSPSTSPPRRRRRKHRHYYDSDSSLPTAIDAADAVTAVDIDLRPIDAIAIPPHLQTVRWTRRLVGVRLLQSTSAPPLPPLSNAPLMSSVLLMSTALLLSTSLPLSTVPSTSTTPSTPTAPLASTTLHAEPRLMPRLHKGRLNPFLDAESAADALRHRRTLPKTLPLLIHAGQYRRHQQQNWQRQAPPPQRRDSGRFRQGYQPYAYRQNNQRQQRRSLPPRRYDRKSKQNL
ncbi:hypothetical protein JRQ81_016936 [Phrynocephalus forsythii]|uniref:Nuclear condensin complex subunit 3 C-terminal domain-containing protein n=1 Tax=Phrynocephalus forsythii TaxID=171643 RepID=A0A9Q0XU80_9SAUR|nr:hypothetical protein JRQ81_016936 [Phrynocephalus forsythii]